MFGFLFLNSLILLRFLVIVTICVLILLKSFLKVKEYAGNIPKIQLFFILLTICLLKICLYCKKYVTLQSIFVSCLIFKREKLWQKD